MLKNMFADHPEKPLLNHNEKSPEENPGAQRMKTGATLLGHPQFHLFIELFTNSNPLLDRPLREKESPDKKRKRRSVM